MERAPRAVGRRHRLQQKVEPQDVLRRDGADPLGADRDGSAQPAGRNRYTGARRSRRQRGGQVHDGVGVLDAGPHHHGPGGGLSGPGREAGQGEVVLTAVAVEQHGEDRADHCGEPVARAGQRDVPGEGVTGCPLGSGRVPDRELQGGHRLGGGVVHGVFSLS
ncbi:hypothetical protein [Streptomyces sp. SID2888]|uniref:hypothetical protein n=1 Tax=Streptomyces sp. SID2888 TaxID=2690256 RepID=UPI001F4918C4|nr:hypothetical protein [Streptomyces sp. SID2888]